MKSDSLCTLLWRLLSWCNLRIIVLPARHIPGQLKVIADKLSHNIQIIQTEWSLYLGIFNQKINRFTTRFNRKLPQFVSPVPDKEAWAVDTEPIMGGHGHVCLPTNSPDSRCHKQDFQSRPSENNSHSSRLAQCVMVLGCSEAVIPDAPLPATTIRSSDHSTGACNRTCSI